MTFDYFHFQRAVPVWEQGKQTEMNHTIECFTTLYGVKDYILYITGASSYLIFVNDMFVAHGPARAAHGYYKVDKILLRDFLKQGKNVIKIRCVGYNVNSFCYLDQTSFLCAEICEDGKVVSCTGDGFVAKSYLERIKKVQRYSYQRPFAESYRLYEKHNDFVELERVAGRTFIERDVPYGEYQRVSPICVMHRGNISISEKEEYYNKREITRISDQYKGYRADELEYASHIEYGKLDFHTTNPCKMDVKRIQLASHEYVDADMGKNQTGLIAMELKILGEGTVFIAFDELMSDGVLNPFRNSSSNIVALEVKEGNYRFVSAEPYGMKYIRIAAIGCAVEICDLSIVEIAFPSSEITAEFIVEDKEMEQIFDAAKLSFRANVVDIYMDCPTRERAGWLCDSFFTARVERVLTGKSVVEKAFLEMFLMPESFAQLPKGMLPMCYPSDVMNGEFIPNWAMWYALELYEYYERTKDSALVENAKEKMLEMYSYFREFENADGFLQGLKGQVFVDASKANDYARMRAISFPTNMLYAAFKSVIGILYDCKELVQEARKLRERIREVAIAETGFFHDNAEYIDGKFICGNEYSEACQYYAFYFYVVSPTECTSLWNTMMRDFRYDSLEILTQSQIAPCNAFIGKYMRLDLLERYGYKEELYDNIRGFFSYMADRTGTLWEYISPTASCNHGFASHVIYWMNRLGVLSQAEGDRK